jgi:hypothetical protein
LARKIKKIEKSVKNSLKRLGNIDKQHKLSSLLVSSMRI